MNPVRGGLMADTQCSELSSAEAHQSGEDPVRIADMSFWHAAGGVTAWARLLTEPEVDVELRALRRATHSGRPFADHPFKAEMHEQGAVLSAKVASKRAPVREVEVRRARP